MCPGFSEQVFTEPVTGHCRDMSGATTERPRLKWDRVRRAAHTLTTPLLPDDYLNLVNPLWTSRELRGRIEEVIPETDDAATLVIRPGWGWRFDHRPGQYVGIGVEVDGRFQWRSYSVSSAPRRPSWRDRDRTITITVRAMPEGFLSTHRSVACGRAPSSGWRCPTATSCCPTPRRPSCSSSSAGAGSPR